MKMVAAAKLLRAQEQAEASRPYAQRMERMLGSLAAAAAGQAGAPRLLAGSGDDQTHLVVVATADRGLCGGFNSRSEEHTSELQSLMRISYAVFCLKKKKKYRTHRHEELIADTV